MKIFYEKQSKTREKINHMKAKIHEKVQKKKGKKGGMNEKIDVY